MELNLCFYVLFLQSSSEIRRRKTFCRMFLEQLNIKVRFLLYCVLNMLPSMPSRVTPPQLPSKCPNRSPCHQKSSKATECLIKNPRIYPAASTHISMRCILFLLQKENFKWQHNYGVTGNQQLVEEVERQGRENSSNSIDSFISSSEETRLTSISCQQL